MTSSKGISTDEHSLSKRTSSSKLHSYKIYRCIGVDVKDPGPSAAAAGPSAAATGPSAAAENIEFPCSLDTAEINMVQSMSQLPVGVWKLQLPLEKRKTAASVCLSVVCLCHAFTI